ncbi:MAG: YbfB/YjiJ family MFS transporter [Myxococcales bacterium]
MTGIEPLAPQLDARAARLPAAGRGPPGLWTALGLSLGPAVSNGLGRFAYALILPAMRADLSWSYTRAGWINTANALGYLAGALLSLRLLSLGLRANFAAGMLLTAASLLASGLVRSFEALVFLRVAAGIGGALAFISGGALATRLFADRPERAPTAIALYFGGGGLGILLTGLTLPWLFEARGLHAWNEAWLGIGVLAFALTLPSLAASARVPADAPRTGPLRWERRPFLRSLLAYFLFAVGSIVYMTFIIAWMRSRGAGALSISLVWGVLGLVIIISPLPWRGPLRTWPGGWPLAASIALTALGAAVPLLSTGLPAMLASAAVFGGAFFIVPAAVTAFAKHSLDPEAWGAAIATYTVAFAIGQPVGPLLAGAVADATGSLFSALLTSVAVLGAGAALAALQPALRPRVEQRS